MLLYIASVVFIKLLIRALWRLLVLLLVHCTLKPQVFGRYEKFMFKFLVHSDMICSGENVRF